MLRSHMWKLLHEVRVHQSKINDYTGCKNMKYVFLPKRFDLAADVDGAPGSTRDFLRLGFLKQLHFSSSVTIRCKNDFLLYRASKMSDVSLRFSICLSFNSCGTHLQFSETLSPLVTDWKQLVD